MREQTTLRPTFSQARPTARRGSPATRRSSPLGRGAYQRTEQPVLSRTASSQDEKHL